MEQLACIRAVLILASAARQLACEDRQRELGLVEEAHPFAGNVYRQPAELAAWLAQDNEEAIDPDRPVIDPHHHLWDDHRGTYLIRQLRDDLGGGHRVVATVFAQCEAMYRAEGPEIEKPLGETEFVTGQAAMSASGSFGPSKACLGVIAFADLSKGCSIDPVLAAHVRAAGGRLRAIRSPAAWDDSSVGRRGNWRPPRHALRAPEFRQAFAKLTRYGLAFDSWVYHPQIDDVDDLAARFPQTTIILDHVGGPVGVGPYAGRRDQVFASWSRSITDLARRPNVTVKLGGLGMILGGFGFHLRPRPPSSTELAVAWQPYVEHCIERFGAKRCMFESNFPPDKQSCTYTTLWNAFKHLAASGSATDQDALFYETARRVYRLDLPPASSYHGGTGEMPFTGNVDRPSTDLT